MYSVGAGVTPTSAEPKSVSVRQTSAVMKSVGSEGIEEPTSAVMKSASEGIVGSDEMEADGLLALAVA